MPSKYHTSVPTRPIYVYARSSGSANLSRVDNVKLIVTHVGCNCLETEVPEEEVNTRTINDSYVIGVDPSGSFVVGASGLTENLLQSE